MMSTLFTRTFALTFIAPTVALLPTLMQPRAQAPSPAEVAALTARCDPSLGALRAGSVDTPAPIQTQERAELRAAQQRSPALDALRAGFQPSDNQWTWLAIGAAIVVLIVLL